MPSQVIINADDFGISDSENQVILAALRQGLVSSATLMVNMPGLADACAMIRSEGLHGRIGLHLNLSHGRPLSREMALDPLFCNAQGEFDPQLSHHHLRLPHATRKALDAELEAQWYQCLAHGVRPTHLDSHHHIHNIWPVGMQVARFAASKGMPLRIARNLGNNIGLTKRMFKTLLNWRLRSLAGKCVSYACTPADLLHQAVPAAGTLEVIVHLRLMGSDFGDDSLTDGHSLNSVLAQHLVGVPRASYAALGPRRAPCQGDMAY